MNEDELIRPSFGDKSGLGWMYDARKDIFLNSGILEQSMPETFIHTKGTNVSRCKIIQNDSWSNTFSALDIPKNMCLSLLSGTVELNGIIGNCFKHVQEESRRSKTTLMYQIKTVSEYIDFFNDELNPFILFDAIDHANATHIVVKTNWGATSIVSFESSEQSQPNQDVFNKKMQAICDSLESLLINQEPRVDNSVKDSEFGKITFRLNADVFAKEKEFTNIGDLRAMLKFIPGFLHDLNNGKGNILSYEMIPLPLLLNRFNLNITGCAIFHSVGDEIISKFVQLFDDIKLQKLCTPKMDEEFISKLEEMFVCRTKTLKQDLASIVVKVRSGEADESTLEKLLNQNRDKLMYLENVKLQSQKEMKNEKLQEFMEIAKSKNVVIIKTLEGLNSLHLKNVAKITYMLIYNSTSAREDAAKCESHMNAFHHLLDTCSTNENTGFAFLNNDLVGHPELNTIAIHKLQGSETISVDVHSEVQKMAQLCLARSTVINPRIKKSTKRGNVVLQCPGAFQKEDPCPDTPHKWQCNTCLCFLQYGFDGNFYCSCGGAPYVSYEFRCSHAESHALCYIKYVNMQQLHDTVLRIEPYKELNIVILGHTGVGKSTWINGFANYLTYDTLKTALDYEPLCLIPMSFSINGIKVELGNKDQNETCVTGESSTQKPRSYIFFVDNIRICLVDTPGVGDIRGTAQDRKNFQNIMSHLAHVKEIHGICILIKPNEARLDVTFHFCIQELLTHLHKDACRNIVFVFTNARNTFYRAGDTYPMLKKFLEEKIGNAIELGKDKEYYMDNEAVRFLAAKKAKIDFDDEEFDIYAKSWLKSVTENKRLMKYILNLPAHKTENTLSLNEARRLILELTKPLAEISKNIQTNIGNIQRKKAELEAMDKNRGDLYERLYIPHTDLETEPLPFPVTVCTERSCIDVLIDKNGDEIRNFKTRCHEHCYLEDVLVQTFPQPELKNCASMEKNGQCRKCGCMWQKHMHITFTTKPVSTKIVDINIQERLKSESGAISAVNEFIWSIDDLVQELNKEQKQINATAAKFGNFLKSNAITPYNDATANYLNYEISIEERYHGQGSKSERLSHLRKLLDEYKEEVRILEDNMKSGQQIQTFTSEDIQKLIAKLYDLPHAGKTLKELMTVSKHVNYRMVEEQAVVHEVNSKRKQNDYFGRVKDAAKSLVALIKHLPGAKQ